MIGDQKTGLLTHAVISAVAHEDLQVTTPAGKKLILAIVDQDGNIIESGQSVAREVRNVSINCYRNLLKGMGHLRVFSEREPLNDAQADAVKRAA